uniref:NHD1 n=1 Tax=Arundo donax TaxID=35708 RepID=A0A0A9GWG3_ARUDO
MEDTNTGSSLRTRNKWDLSHRSGKGVDGDFEQLDMILYQLHNLQGQNRSPCENTKRSPPFPFP